MLWTAGFAAAGFLAGLLISPAWGWSVLAAGLLALLFWHARHLSRLRRWLANPLPGQVPEGEGIWDEVLAALHRLERDAAKRERRLADALARMRGAVQALPDGVVILDSANRIEWCNRTAERQLMLDARADLGHNIANLVREPEFVDYLAQPQEKAVRVTRGQGMALSLQLILVGETQKLLLARDVTQAERVDAMRRDFVANVSHELRTPLTAIRTSVGLLLDPGIVPSPDQRQQLLSTIGRSADRMQRLLTELLDLARLRSGRAELQRAAFDARDVARDVAAAVEPMAAARSQRVRMELPERAVRMVGDRRRLEQALLNLVANAQKFSPAGAEIDLSLARTDDGAVRWTVVDRGPGIGAEEQARLFERFFVGTSDGNVAGGGAGIGLPTALAIAQGHGGTIEVDSEVGRGSIFHLVVPAGGRT